MAEQVYPVKHVGTDTIQVVYDAEHPDAKHLGEWAGRVLDVDGKLVHQTPWTTGNGWAIERAEEWLRTPAAMDRSKPAAVAAEATELEPAAAPAATE